MCSTETIYDFSLNTIELFHQNLLIYVQLIYSLMQNRVTHCPEGQKKKLNKKVKVKQYYCAVRMKCERSAIVYSPSK